MFANDDIDLTYSNQDRLTKSELSARKEKLKTQLGKKGLKPDIANTVDPTRKLKLSMLKQNIITEGQKDAKTKEDKLQKEKTKKQSFGPKTHKEEEEQAKLTADVKLTAETIVKQNVDDAKADEELQKTDVSTEGG